MAYRIEFNFKTGPLEALNQFKGAVPQLAQAIVQDSADLIATYGKEHLSGTPFTSRTGGHTIQKRSGRGAASVQVQYPYGSPYRSRVFASAMARYSNNPEDVDYLSVLEYGRGEIRPKYTPSAARGNYASARLTIPGGPHQLVNGQNGFRGMSGRYSFAKSIPPMEGKYWFASAVERAGPEIEERANLATIAALQQHGLG